MLKILIYQGKKKAPLITNWQSRSEGDKLTDSLHVRSIYRLLFYLLLCQEEKVQAGSDTENSLGHDK